MLFVSRLPSRLLWLGVSAFLATCVLLAVVRPAHGSEPELKPNLVADPPDNVHIEASATEGGISKVAGEPKLLLRFNGYVHNDGAGPLDIHGEREEPQVSKQTEEEVERIRKHNQEAEAHGESDLEEESAQTEAELATPKMQVTQQLFATDSGAPVTNPETDLTKFGEENEKYLQRAAKKEATTDQMEYVNADGHHHWHLEHVAKYSLWNSEKTAEVAPAQKVGFCLEDSEHVELTDTAGVTGPLYPVYADSSPPYRDFCQQWRPNTNFVFEGISPGWRDRYDYTLGLQWVDISDVLPGKYWLREQVNPEGKIIEEGKGEKVAFATEPTIVPGFDALPNAVETPLETPVRITATSRAWEDQETPIYAITKPPQHGQIEPIPGTNEAIYTPEPGYSGEDDYSFIAYDPTSEFPLHPAEAEVSITVGAASAPQVTISGEPSAMIAGTSVQLSAKVINDSPAVSWSASEGTITQTGLYTAPPAPPAGGSVTISAWSSKGVEKRISIRIEPAPPVENIPAAPPASTPPAGGGSPSGGGAPKKASPSPALSRPQAMLIGHELVMSTRVGKAGRVHLSAYLGRQLLGSCSVRISADRDFTCRIKLSKRVSLNARIGVVATLQIGRELLRSARPAARVPQMKMGGARVHTSARAADRLTAPSSWRYWCSPSMLM